MTTSISERFSLKIVSKRSSRSLCARLAIVCGFCLSLPLYGQTNVFPTSGNVGIGTTSPGALFDVNGSTIITGGVPWGIGGQGEAATKHLLLGYDTTNSIGYLSSVQNGVTHTSLRLKGQDFSVWTGYGAVAQQLTVTVGGNVGIGTTLPGTKLHISTAPGTNFADGLTLQSNSTSAGEGSSILWTDSSGSEKARIFQTAAGNSFRFLSSGPIMFNTNITGATGTNQRMVIDTTGNVGIGTTNPTTKLSVNGTITTKEVIVTNTGWADYVFKPGYQLKPLREIAAYIKENQHLPEIPSEAEVQEKGVSVGEMQAKLLAKVEELTLHMIQEHERNDRLEARNDRLEQEIRQLRSRIIPGAEVGASGQDSTPRKESPNGH